MSSTVNCFSVILSHLLSEFSIIIMFTFYKMTTAYHYTYFYSHFINHSIISISNSSDKNLLDQSDTSDKTYEQDTYHLLLPMPIIHYNIIHVPKPIFLITGISDFTPHKILSFSHAINVS